MAAVGVHDGGRNRPSQIGQLHVSLCMVKLLQRRRAGRPWEGTDGVHGRLGLAEGSLQAVQLHEPRCCHTARPKNVNL